MSHGDDTSRDEIGIIRPVDTVLTAGAMRIAWIGEIASGGGVASFGAALVRGLLDRGHHVTLFTVLPPHHFTKLLGPADHRYAVVQKENRWQWGRWYSRDKLLAFVTGTMSRARAYRRLVRELVRENQRERFDVILQFSQAEIFSLAKHLTRLPPLVLFPCVHAAGELRWHRLESRFALAYESIWRHYLARATLIYRDRVQRRTFRKAAGVLGMSRRFNELLRLDYGVDPQRQAVVYQPLPPEAAGVKASAGPATGNGVGERDVDGGRPIRFVFAARLSVRKGLDLIIDLSRRLDDLAGRVSIELIGGATLWSDYSGHLRDLNLRIAQVTGPLPHDQLMRRMAVSDALVLPSKYEPGGIVVAEALSMGCCCVVSDEVGSAEPLNEQVCRRFASGDAADLERTCRKLMADLLDTRQELREAARSEARVKFSATETTDSLERALRAATSGRRQT